MSLLPPRKRKTAIAEQSLVSPAFQERFIRMPELERIVGYKKSTIYELIRDGRFPDRIKLSRGASVWKLSEVNAWLNGEFTPAEPAKTTPALKLVRHSKGGSHE